MAGEIDVPVWTASQANSSALEEDIIEANKVAEAYSKWKNLVEKHSSLMDRDVLNRMFLGKRMTKLSLMAIYEAEKKLSKKLHFTMDNYDAILMPTIPILPPTINEVKKDIKTLL